MFATAFVTALPPYAAPPSRSSSASPEPVLAPEGTAARPGVPPSSVTSASTVGLPRLSKICLAVIDVIVKLIFFYCITKLTLMLIGGLMLYYVYEL